MEPSLASARAKTFRASELIETLGWELTHYLHGKEEGEGPSHRFVDSLETDDEGVLWRVTRVKVERDPPDQLGLLLGDTCHNLRSSLDHTATQLWRLNKKTPPKRGANFPIYARALNQRDRHKIQAALKGMRAEHRDYIRSKQPYRAKDDPQAWALGVIAAIDNYDKHELIHTRFLSRPTHRICQP